MISIALIDTKHPFYPLEQELRNKIYNFLKTIKDDTGTTI